MLEDFYHLEFAHESELTFDRGELTDLRNHNIFLPELFWLKYPRKYLWFHPIHLWFYYGHTCAIEYFVYPYIIV